MTQDVRPEEGREPKETADESIKLAEQVADPSVISATGGSSGEAEPALLEEDDADGAYDETEGGYIQIRTSVFAVAATIASLLLLVLLAGDVYQFVRYRGESTIATVNGAPITQAEFDHAAGAQDQALQSLIDQRLIQQEAKRQKVTVPDQEVSTQIGTIKQQLGSDKEFSAALQRANLSESQLRDEIRMQKLAQLMGAKDVSVSDDEAQAFYNQNKSQFGTQSFDQTKDQIKQQLIQQKQSEAIQAWIAGLRQKAKINVHLPA